MPVETYRILEWLTRAADDPEQAHREWDQQGVTLLRCGKTFGVIRIPARLVRAGLVADDFPVEDLAVALGGPVIHDGRESPYWALIHGHAGLVWSEGDDVPSLGSDHYLGVPRLDRTVPPGPHWAVLPRFDGDVCRPSTLRRFIAQARERVGTASVEV